MTETIDQLIQARFDVVANSFDDGDWSDVLIRARTLIGVQPARRRIPTRLALAAAVAALAAAVTAVAFGWPQTFVDFFSSPPAPDDVQNWFGAENVAAPSGMSPDAIPGEARKIATATFDADHADPDHPIVHTLYVAPRHGGGFCYLWTDYEGGCADADRTPAYARTHPAARPLGVSWLGNDFPLVVSGWVRTGAAKTVEARFADGTKETIPVTWISPPIDAGFFVYPVPVAHQTRADALASVVALDAKGNVVGSQDFRLTDPLDEDVTQTLPDGTQFSLPRRADATKAQKVISFTSSTGSEVFLWVMPRTGGGVCYLTNRSEGCDPPGATADIQGAFNGGLAGGADPVLFFAQTKPEVAAIELRYQNGESDRVTPVDGFVLTEIPPAHYPQGTRLVAAVALDQAGSAIDTEPFHPEDVGVYPCDKPVDLGYGVKACP
jgi:hypothetical protein